MMPEYIKTLPWDLIRCASNKYDLNPYIIASIIMTESAGNTWATRFEAMWKYYTDDIDDHADRLRITAGTEITSQQTSWGLMQVMGSVAREHGFKRHLTELCDPEVGIHYGCLHLKKFYDKYDSIVDAISSYNAGGPYKTEDGKYKNKEYVDRVLKYQNELITYGT